MLLTIQIGLILQITIPMMPIVLHGSESWGTDNEQQLYIGMTWRVNSEYHGYNEFTIVPQAPTSTGWYNDNNIESVYNIIRNTIDNFSVDTTKIAVTGVSQGGYGTWRMLDLYPQFFSAGIPVAGIYGITSETNFKHYPVWIFHGTDDELVFCKYLLRN